MGKKLIPEVIIPEHWEYECDFFHTDDENPTPMDELYGIKVNQGGGKAYGMLVSPLSDSAAFIICKKCMGNFCALEVQAKKTIDPLRSSSNSNQSQ